MQSKLGLNERGTIMSEILLKGLHNNVGTNNIGVCKDIGALPSSASDISNNVCRGNVGAFSAFTSLGINTDQLQVTRPRMRICFDPETEIPRLQKWFAENNHPTRQQVLTKFTLLPNYTEALLVTNKVKLVNQN